MFARIVRMQIKIDRIDEASRLFEEKIIPNCKKQNGFKGAYFLADRKTGTCIPITFWDSEEDLLANERNLFFQEQLVKFMTFFTKPPIREAYKVEVKKV